ncbi:MAG TPA: 6-phosphogluconolactonase [Blastocatellia bacterium]|nr:6-phosphogluconolactonase [Blastocatellia bacterium]
MPEHNVTKIILCRDAGHLAATAAQEFTRLAVAAVSNKGLFSVALSGGSTPKATFELLATEPLFSRIPWPSVHLFWSDERTVPPDHRDSNYRMAYEAMISRVPLPAANVHRMKGEIDPEIAATQYASELDAHFDTAIPRFDLIMLGMGDDGHTASLFPGTKALSEADASVVVNYVSKFSTNRLTFSVQTINNAACVMFLISGSAKVPALKEVIEGTRNPQLYPSQLIHPANGDLEYLIDRDAAARLEIARAALSEPPSDRPIEIKLV